MEVHDTEIIDVSIIIVSWNTKDILRDCINSIIAQTKNICYELIIVDNASTDYSAEMVENEFPAVKLIRNEQNVGFAAANNQGIKIVGGRYLLLINPDTIVLDNAIEKTIIFAEKNLNTGVIGCQVWRNEQEIQKTCFPFPSLTGLIIQKLGLRRLFPTSKMFGWIDYGWWDRKSLKDVDVVSGMYMLVRKEAVKQVGLMDEDYFVYAEETDWCFRFSKAGWRCVFYPDAKIIHLDGGKKSTEQVSVRMFVQLQKSILIFYKKNRGILSWFMAKLIFSLTLSLELIYFIFVNKLSKKNIHEKRINQNFSALKFHLLGQDVF